MRHLFGILIFAFVSNAFSLQPDDFCGMQATAGSSSQLGGRYISDLPPYDVPVLSLDFLPQALASRS